MPRIIHFYRCDQKKCPICNQAERILIELAVAKQISFPTHCLENHGMLMVHSHRGFSHKLKIIKKQEFEPPNMIIGETIFLGVDDITNKLPEFIRALNPPPAELI